MEDIQFALIHSDHEISKKAAEMIAKKSPMSLKITLRAMQEGSDLNFDECMRQEFRLVSRFLQGHDFAEGIRAVIIDKDQTPHWEPPTLASVTNEQVEKYFASLEHDLV
jgi:enoyl-CoA hydratase